MLVSVQRQALTNIWITARGELDQLTQITSGGGRYFDLAWTPDGKLLYASDATGSADIWEMEAGGTEQRQLTAGAGKNYAPAISPDGRYVVFHSNRTGHWNIWRMDRDGSNPTPLTVGDEDSNWPQVSPDGRWVVYEHVGSGTLATVWKVPIAGGPPVRLTGGLSTRPAISPDGKWIACWQKEETPNAPWRIAIVPFEGGQSVKFLDVPQNAASGNTPMRWTADGRGVVYVDFRNGVTNLLRQPLDGGPAEALTHFTKDLFYSFDLGRDGRLALSRGLRTHDAVLIREAK